jgi:predicted RNase H-like HicB family nuclease
MKKVRVFIERGKDGSYGAYMPDDNKLHFGAIGEGESAQEAHDDFLAVIDAYREDFPEEIAKLQFVFSYDVASFVAYYAGKITLAGLSRITGVSAAQLSQYANGYRYPSPKTTAKIQAALNAFGTELSQLQLV